MSFNIKCKTMLFWTGQIPGTAHVAASAWRPTRNRLWEAQACATWRREALWTDLCGRRQSWWRWCAMTYNHEAYMSYAYNHEVYMLFRNYLMVKVYVRNLIVLQKWIAWSSCCGTSYMAWERGPWRGDWRTVTKSTSISRQVLWTGWILM